MQCARPAGWLRWAPSAAAAGASSRGERAEHRRDGPSGLVSGGGYVGFCAIGIVGCTAAGKGGRRGQRAGACP